MEEDYTKKYFEGHRKIYLDNVYEFREGSPIWNFIEASLLIIQEKLTWVLGNERHINIWKVNIMGKQRLITNQGLLPLYNWLTQKGNNTLYDNSYWFNSGSWMGYNFGHWNEVLPFRPSVA
jgi:hypothetical protein